MSQEVSVPLSHQQRTLDLAFELMTRAGYQPQIRQRGIVRWTREKNPEHNCEVIFESFRGLIGISYISFSTCECKETWVLREVWITFKRELSLRGWLATKQLKIFNSMGII